MVNRAIDKFESKVNNKTFTPKRFHSSIGTNE